MDFSLHFHSVFSKKLHVSIASVVFLASVYSNTLHTQDYFPLEIENIWVYEIIAAPEETVRTAGIAEIDENEYYKFSISDKYHSDTLFYRRDTLNQILKFSRYDSSERILYRLNAKLGDKWNYGSWIAEFTGMSNITTPAGQFKNCLSYYYDDQETSLFMFHYLAPEVGLVLQLGENWWKHLVCAIVNGVIYGDVTHSDQEELKYIPSDFALLQNYPNPFNANTDIRYQIVDNGSPVHTTLTIYNILGQKVRTLVDEPKEAGHYSVLWDGKDNSGKEMASGVYFYRLAAGTFNSIRRMVFLR